MRQGAGGGEQNLVYIGEDVTKKFEWTPASVFVVEHHQKKYERRAGACPTPRTVRHLSRTTR